jgi:endo-1,4-beta-xylanase
MIYPGRAGDIQPTAASPPTFLAAAYDDRQDISEGLAEAYLRFKRAGVPAELHIYGTGGHGFGLRSTDQRPVGQWIVRFEEWLGESGFLRNDELPRPVLQLVGRRTEFYESDFPDDTTSD